MSPFPPPFALRVPARPARERRPLAGHRESVTPRATLLPGAHLAPAVEAGPVPQTAPVRRLYIVEDHPVVREGYALLFRLAPDLDVAGMAVSAEEALASLPSPPPDLVIVDMALPGMSGLDLLAALRERLPGLRMLVVSGQSRQVYEAQAHARGAVGFVSKDDGPEALLAAVRAAFGVPPPTGQ